LAADWDKHGAKFIERCREEFPQVYATMQRMRIEDELARAPGETGPLVIRWMNSTDEPALAPGAPTANRFLP
jgi:hypothetical protein